MKPFSLLWKYKFYAGLFFIVAAIVGTTAYLSRQERNKEKEAGKTRQIQSEKFLRK